jgi:hypothetical protein
LCSMNADAAVFTELFKGIKSINGRMMSQAATV